MKRRIKMTDQRRDVILIVDDNNENLKFLGNILREKGYTPIVSQSDYFSDRQNGNGGYRQGIRDGRGGDQYAARSEYPSAPTAK